MARTDTLNHFLTDVADAIRTKTGSAAAITASSFDTEIENIPTSGGDPTDYFNGDFKDSTKAGQIWFSSEYIKSTAQLVPIDCTGKVDLHQMFDNCGWSKIPKLINMNAATNLSGMYQNCANVTTIDTSAWNTTRVTKFANLFYGCTKLTTVDLSNITTGALSGASSDSFYQLFTNCSSLTSIDMHHMVLPSTGNLNRIPSMSSMFTNCKALTSLTPPTTAFKTNGNWSGLFNNCQVLPSADIIAFINKINNPEDCSSLRGTFSNCKLLENISLDIHNANSLNTYQECYQAFSNCSNLKSVNLILNGSSQFQECFQYAAAWGSRRGESLTPEIVNISIKAMNNNNTLTGTMSKMYYACCAYAGAAGSGNATDMTLNIDYNNATWNQTYFEPMFQYCAAKVVNFKNLKITNTSTSSFMLFSGVGEIEELHIINCDFSGCKNYNSFLTQSMGTLKILDLSGLTSATDVTNVSNFCSSCSALELIDVRNFTFSNATSFSSFLWGVPTTCTIVVKDATEKAWFNTNFSTYTNVMTVAEYEAQ
jgi:hypothetical protein